MGIANFLRLRDNIGLEMSPRKSCNEPPREPAPAYPRNPKMRNQEDEEENSVNAVVELFCVLQEFYSFVANDKNEHCKANVEEESVY